MTTPPAPQSDPLVVALQHTEAELAEKLEEACVPDTREVSEESTAELAKLSDSLLAAARAAKDVVSLRKRRHQRGSASDQPASEEAIREFRDIAGREWRVWAVTPSHSRTSKREANLGEFEQGWLAFETLDEELRKRLPHYPAEWRTMSEAKLQELLGLAVEAPMRRLEPRRPDPRSEPPR
ncbi:MAG TPA: hypothetical protein VJ802_14465 [Gemmatimonadaceae bacterium]|nr:hypothetical protein [Gemmatimonadaceae bacterium]